MRCANCGRDTHITSDCTKPYSGWREAAKPLPEPESAPAASLAPAASVLAPVIETATEHYSGRLPTRPDFPFVGPAQKAEIERRERLKADRLQKVREVREDRPAPLPAKPKQLKQEALC